MIVTLAIVLLRRFLLLCVWRAEESSAVVTKGLLITGTWCHADMECHSLVTAGHCPSHNVCSGPEQWSRIQTVKH